MQREIIRIDEAKCDGCGECASGCPEGALQVIDGKARLVSEITCDGLGACVGTCPQGAISVEVREAAAYDERATLVHILPMGSNTLAAHLEHLRSHGQTRFLAEALAYLAEQGLAAPPPTPRPAPASCPGSAPITLLRSAPPPAAAPPVLAEGGLDSQLGQWPVQLHLISPLDPVFQGADLLLTADCVAFAMADFNQRCLPGKALAVACPKLDHGQDRYLDKLTALVDEAQINSLTVMIMEVPCCGGLLQLARAAAHRARRPVPIKLVVVGVRGNVRREEWVTAPPTAS